MSPAPAFYVLTGTKAHCSPTMQLMGTFCHLGENLVCKKGHATPMTAKMMDMMGRISRVC